METKTCSICGTQYLLINENFFRQKSSCDGFKKICKRCIAKTADRHKKDGVVQIKACLKCGEEKPLNQFAKSVSKSDGHKSHCKICGGKATKEYVRNNKEKVKNAKREHYEKNKDVIIKKVRSYYFKNKDKKILYLKNYTDRNKVTITEYQKLYRETNRDKNKKYQNERYQAKANLYAVYAKNNKERIKKNALLRHHKRYYTDPKYKLNLMLSTLIRQSLKGKKQGEHWETLVGYTLNELISHLEGLFKEGMSWGNHGEWHIDHIKPKSRFNYKSHNDQEFKECWSLNNLQPLWAIDNLRKGNKVI